MALSNSRPLSLRAVLVLAFVIQLVAIWALVTWLSLRDGRQMVRGFSARIADGVMRQVQDRLQPVFAGPTHLLDAVGWALGDAPGARAPDGGPDPIAAMLGVSRQVDRLWHLGPDGRALAATRDAAGVVHVGSVQAPAQAADPVVSAACRARVSDMGGAGWCGPYIAPGGRLVVARVKAITSAPGGGGWWIAEVEMARLEAFVRQVAGAVGARVFLVDSASRLVADSGGAVGRKRGESTPNLEALHKSRDPLIKQLSQTTWSPSTEVKTRLEAKGLERAFSLRMTPLELPGMGAWRLGVLVPDESLVDDVSQNRELTIVLCLLVIALAAFGAIGISRRISRPLARIVRRTQRVQAGDLDVDFKAGIAHEFIEIQQMSQALGEMVEGLRDKDRIHDALGRYVSPELASRFLTDPTALALGGQIQEVTLLMSDLRGFTGLSERLAPEVMVRLLNRYLAAMTEVIHAHGGTIIEFIGDAVFAVFGAPVSAEDDAFRATLCAVQMAHRLEAFNAGHADQSLPALEMGIGLHTGVVVAGNIGSERATKYGVVGEPVNVTARIESLTVGPMILMSDTTYQVVRARVDIRHTRTVRLKGLSAPLRVHALQAVHGERVWEVPCLPEEPRVAVTLPVQVRPVIGKTVAARSIPGRIVALGARRAVLRLSSSLNVLDRLCLAACLDDGVEVDGAYATVQAVENSLDSPEHPVRAEVVFTSMPPEWIAAIERLRQDAQPT